MPLPFPSHRTLQEVAETEKLSKLRLKRMLSSAKSRRLYALLSRADINNPPPLPVPDDAA